MRVLYPILLIAGLVGLIVMGFLGFVHPHHATRAHLRFGRAHATAVGHSAVAPNAAQHGSIEAADQVSRMLAGPTGESSTSAELLFFLLSPVNWFAWLVGAGAAGMLGGLAGIGEVGSAVAAVCGAIAFHAGIVSPLWNAVFDFASVPAGNLESCVMQRVKAVGAFDKRGEGLVRIIIDGQSEDILARLSAAARANGVLVRRGDELIVEAVDVRANRCIVSRFEP